jgi:hypothetical protein
MHLFVYGVVDAIISVQMKQLISQNHMELKDQNIQNLISRKLELVMERIQKVR